MLVAQLLNLQVPTPVPPTPPPPRGGGGVGGGGGGGADPYTELFDEPEKLEVEVLVEIPYAMASLYATSALITCSVPEAKISVTTATIVAIVMAGDDEDG